MPWNPDGTRKSSTYKMKYSNSTFPFKSPLHDHEKDKDGNVIKHSKVDATLVKAAKVESKDTKTKKKKTELTGVVGGKKVTFTPEQLKNIGVE